MFSQDNSDFNKEIGHLKTKFLVLYCNRSRSKSQTGTGSMITFDHYSFPVFCLQIYNFFLILLIFKVTRALQIHSKGSAAFRKQLKDYKMNRLAAV